MSVVRWRDPGSLELPRIVSVLRAGGLLVYPTETVYGIGTALSAGDEGIEKVRRAKSAKPGRPYLVLVGDAESAFALWSGVNSMARALGQKAWPGPLTLVGPARDGLPQSLLGRDDGVPDPNEKGAVEGVATISVRVPGDPRLRALVDALGEPLVSTSANPSGETAPDSFEAIALDRLAPDLAVDGGTCQAGMPSTLVSVVGSQPRLLRAGAWPFEEGAA